MSGFKITSAKGVHVTFENGWSVSIQWGPGNYCDNYGASFYAPPPKDGWSSSTAEIAAWPERGPHAGDMYDFGGDSVLGRVKPGEVLAWLNKFAAMPSVDKEPQA